MITWRSRLLGPLLIVLAFVGVLGTNLTTASAQVDVVGSADFRSAPTLPPGRYADRIVTGDTAWFAVVYTNNTPYRFAVSIPGIDLDASSELSLTASFVAPTLTTIGEPASEVTGNGVEYPAGHTNVWFLKISLETTATPGVEYRVLIDVEGVESTSLQSCASIPACTFDEELAVLDQEFAEVDAALTELRAQETIESVSLEIDNLRGFVDSADTLRPAAEGRLGRAEARMATLCAPDLTCTTFPDPGTQVPIFGWILGVLAVGGGAAIAFKKLTNAPEVTSTGPS